MIDGDMVRCSWAERPSHAILDGLMVGMVTV